MKAKVVIENGETEVILTPQNEFEIDVLEKIHDKKQNYSIYTTVEADYQMSGYGNFRLVANIKETK